MRKFWLSGSADINKEDTEKDDDAGGGIVNNAFAEDEFDMSYTRWKNLGVIEELEENIYGNKTKEVENKKTLSEDSGNEFSSKQSSATDSEDTTYSEIDIDPLQKPTRSVSRLNMIQKLTEERARLGTVCQEESCPYNKWLYRGHKFPEDKTVELWELGDKKEEKLTLETFSLPRVILSNHKKPVVSNTFTSSTHKSHKTSNSFHYSKSPYPFAFPNPTTSVYLPTFNPPDSSGPPTPSTAPLPPYPWHLYSSSPTASHSIASSYPIVTLPRSARKNHKKSTPSSSAQSCISSFYKKSPPAPIFNMKPKFQVSSSSSSFSSCSCSSSCSSCDTCTDLPLDPRSPYAFTQDTRTGSPRRKRHPCLPRCDATCCVIISFILASLLGLVTLLLYLYLFSPVMEDTGEM